MRAAHSRTRSTAQVRSEEPFWHEPRAGPNGPPAKTNTVFWSLWSPALCIAVLLVYIPGFNIICEMVALPWGGSADGTRQTRRAHNQPRRVRSAVSFPHQSATPSHTAQACTAQPPNASHTQLNHDAALPKDPTYKQHHKPPQPRAPHARDRNT